LGHEDKNKDQRASGSNAKGGGDIKEKPLSRKMAKSDARKLEWRNRRRKVPSVRPPGEWRAGSRLSYPGVTGPDPFRGRSQRQFSEISFFHHGGTRTIFTLFDSKDS